MNVQEIIDALDALNCTKKEALKSFLGKPGISGEWNYGSIPTDKIKIETENGLITCIKWWSGLNWSARGGYGSPSIQVP